MWTYAQHQGFWAVWKELIDLSDPRGEINAYKVNNFWFCFFFIWKVIFFSLLNGRNNLKFRLRFWVCPKLLLRAKWRPNGEHCHENIIQTRSKVQKLKEGLLKKSSWRSSRHTKFCPVQKVADKGKIENPPRVWNCVT